MQALIVIFLIGVGAFALVVTFPWGLAILLIVAILTIGLEATAEGVSNVLKWLTSSIFTLILFLIAAFLVVGFLTKIFS